jgi:enoyl-CoA hydratase
VSSYETIAVELADSVALVRLDRPDRMNALSATLVRELGSVVAEAERDDAVHVLVITGDERAFSAGADLKETAPPLSEEEINSVFNGLENLPKPTIAAIRGWCIAGGLELALACDLRVAATDAKIGDWHVKIDSIGGAGATVRLARLVGLARAKELVYTGAAVNGEAAYRIGLVNRVCSADDVVETALVLGREIAEHNPVTLAHAKRALRLGADLDLCHALEVSLQVQGELVRALGGDFGARFEARQEKRRSRARS